MSSESTPISKFGYAIPHPLMPNAEPANTHAPGDLSPVSRIETAKLIALRAGFCRDCGHLPPSQVIGSGA